jgi:hypothetical protein
MTKQRRAYRESAKYVEVESYTHNTNKVTYYGFGEWGLIDPCPTVVDVKYYSKAMSRRDASRHRRVIASLILKHYEAYFTIE